MIKIAETEFYSKTSNTSDKEPERTPIDGYELPEKGVFCKDCKFFSESIYDFDGWEIPESCSHPEHVSYTYSHTGRHSHMAWSPQDKNKELKCELYEEKKSIAKRVAVKLGIIK